MTDNIVKILDNINDIYKKENNIQTIINRLILKPQRIAGNYELAPVIEWHDNICYFISAMHLLYRIEELIPFIIHPNIKGQYKADSAVMNYINFLELMYNKAKEKVDIITIRDQGDLPKKCIEASNIVFGRFSGSYDIYNYISMHLGNICHSKNNMLLFDHEKFCKYKGDVEIQVKTLSINDPRSFFMISKETFLFQTNIKATQDDIFKFNQRINKLYDEQKYKEIQELVMAYKPTFSPLDKTTTNIITMPVFENREEFEGKVKKLFCTYRISFDSNGYINIRKVVHIPGKYIYIYITASSDPKTKKTILLEDFTELTIGNPFDNIMKIYELIGVSILYHGGACFHTYIKHDKDWYMYPDLTGPRSLISNSSNSSFAIGSSIFLYREKNEHLFDTIDPNIVPSNVNEYLEKYGVDV